MKNRLLVLAALGEALTGLVLFVYPPIGIKLLFGTEAIGAAVVMSRIAGIALIALGLACWPCATMSCGVFGMLTYSALATFYLLYVAIGGEWVGPLLWPAVVLHAALTLLLAGAWFKRQENPSN
ncbi:MAG: hypothetical protein ACM3KL_01910 [Alphaproteobacteria bacterium]